MSHFVKILLEASNEDQLWLTYVKNKGMGTSLVVQWPPQPNARGPGSTWSGNGSHMPQLRVLMPQQRPGTAK